MSLLVPDRNGRRANVVLGFDSPEEYRDNPRYIGAIVGRCANRIANARFTLDGKTYRLAANMGSDHLHGGVKGFDQRVWRAACGVSDLELGYVSPDGEEGYPGTLDVRVTYTLTDRNELIVEYFATTDKPTPVNVTQHSYFNLAGAGDVLEHVLQIDADAITPLNENLIPTGAVTPVAATPFDFRTPTAIGARRGGAYDQNFVLKGGGGAGGAGGARVVEPRSGRTLDVRTTEPGVQLYTGYPRGLCLETQQFPDAPNQPDFPSTILRPGSEYRSRTVFTFGILKASKGVP